MEAERLMRERDRAIARRTGRVPQALFDGKMGIDHRV